MTVLPDLDAVRKNLGRSLFGLVAGPDGPANRSRIHDTPGPRWFDEDRPIRRVHADASMFPGGVAALLLQSLHPLAMAGVAGSLGYLVSNPREHASTEASSVAGTARTSMATSG